MRVALVNPPLPRRYVRTVDEPLHLEYLTSQIRDHHDVFLIDALSLGLDLEEATRRVLAVKPDIAGISAGFTGTVPLVKTLCKKVKEADPRIFTLLGGNTATFLAEELVTSPHVNAVLLGEADMSFPLLVEAVEKRRPLQSVPGLAFPNGGRPVRTPPLQPADLDVLPFPSRDLLPFRDQYLKAVLAARGCAYACPYCSTSAFWGRRIRLRSVANVLEEVAHLASEERLPYFAFADDCFTVSRRRVMDLCSGLKRIGIDATWSCTGRIETITRDLLEAMHSAGCRDIFFGVESGSRRVLQKLGRPYGSADVERVYETCLRVGIRPSFSFIVGLPYETRSDFEETLELIDRLEGVECGTHLLTPFPGTPIAERPDAFDLEILPHGVGDLDINSRSFVDNGFISPEDAEEALREGIGRGFRALRRSRRVKRICGGLPE